jgi:hypothetical protein
MTALPAPSPEQVAEARRYGSERQINPYTAILEEVRRTAAHVAWLGMKVAEAPSDDALLEGYSGWLKLYQQERAHLVKVSDSAIRLGLEERVVRVEEQKAEVMIRALIATLDALGLPAETRERIPLELRKQLMAVDAETHR